MGRDELYFPGILNKCRNFHRPIQDLWTIGELTLPNRYINLHTLLGSSVLLSCLSSSTLTCWDSGADVNQQSGKAARILGVPLWFVPAGTNCRAAYQLEPYWWLDAMQDVQHTATKTLYKTAWYKSPSLCILHGETDHLSDLVRARDGFVSRICIPQVPALAVLVMNSSTYSGVWLQVGWISCIERTKQSKLLKLHRKSLLCPDSHRAWKLIVWVHLSQCQSLNYSFVNRLQMLWIKSWFSRSRSSLKE